MFFFAFVSQINWISFSFSFVNTDIQYEQQIQRWPILNNIPFMCPPPCDHLSAPPSPFLPFGVFSSQNAPSQSVCQVSFTCSWTLHKLVLAGSTGSSHLSTKQIVNSRFMPRGCDTSTTHSPNMFLHRAANRIKGNICSSAAAHI